MTNPPALFVFLGYPIRLHWSAMLTIPLVAGHALFTQSPYLALLYSIVTLFVFLSVLAQGFVKIFLASRVGFGTRDLIVYPFWTNVRYTTVSERPWQEIFVSVAGPVSHAMIAVLISICLGMAGHGAGYPEPADLGSVASLAALLCWCNLLLALLHLFPFLPLEMGQLFRASLAMTSGRLIATEIASHLSSFGAVLMFTAGVAWLDSPLLGCLGLSLYLSCQEDLGRMRYFASIQSDRAQVIEPVPSIMIPIEQIVDENCQPPEERFSGFTWNRKTRLWIQWLEGRAIGANALVGD